MKLDTPELKTAYFMGFLHALASEHAKEYKRDEKSVIEELINKVFEKQKENVK